MNLDILYPRPITLAAYNPNGGLIRCVISRDGNNLTNQMELEFDTEKVKNATIALFSLFRWVDAPDSYHKNIYIAISVKRKAKRIIIIAEEFCRFILRKCAVMPFEHTGTFQSILNKISENSIPDLGDSENFSFSEVINSSSILNAEGTVSIKTPCRMLELFKGMEGSLADVFGIQIVLTSGRDSNGITATATFKNYPETIADTVVAGRDLEEWESNADSEDYQNNIVGYWRGTENDEETVVTASTVGMWTAEYYPDVTSILDCSSMFKEKPSQSSIESKIRRYSIERRQSWNDKNYSIKLRDGYSFKAGDGLVKRAIDAKIGNLIRVELPGVSISSVFVARVVSTEYDCLTERYTSITLGEKLDSFGRMLAKDIKR